MLQRVKPEVGQFGDIFAERVDAEQAAFFVHPFVRHRMAHQNAVSQACRRGSSEMRMSDPTWRSSPPTTPIVCNGSGCVVITFCNSGTRRGATLTTIRPCDSPK